MARVGLVFGGRSVEHRVSVTSARTVAKGLAEAGHEVVPLGIAESGEWVEREAGQAALDGEVDALAGSGGAVAPTVARLVEDPPEVIFPIVHGTYGEDGTLQGFCEILDLPYVGAGVTATAMAMDKIAAKRALAAAGVPVVDYAALRAGAGERNLGAFVARAADEVPGPPWFVKPAVGGSSVGVRKAADRDELAEAVHFALRFDDAVLVERAVAGRELECAVLGYGELEASAIGEIVSGRDFYDYEDKYVSDGAQLIAPAEIPERLAGRLRELAVEAFATLGGVGLARVDFLVEETESGSEAWVNEINTLPGFTAISMYPRLWDLSGVPLPELVDRLVEIARERHRDRRHLDEGIRSFLDSLGE